MDTTLKATKTIIVKYDTTTKNGLGLTEAQTYAKSGTTDTVTLGGVEFFVLAVEDKATYTSTSGGTATTKTCALLWTVEPWKTSDGEYFTSLFVSSGTQWSTSTLRTNLQTEVSTQYPITKVAQFVANTDYSYATSANVTAYDRFFPLSSAEHNTYVGSYNIRAYDNAGSVGGIGSSYGYRWLRSAASATNANVNGGNTGYNATAGTNDTRGVRPALWAAL